jgi:hypothetical protein
MSNREKPPTAITSLKLVLTNRESETSARKMNEESQHNDSIPTM